MILIGENIHIISKKVSEAIESRDRKAIQELARAQEAAGADYIDVNMGPARKDPEDLAKWLVNAVQEVTTIPLSIDTVNPVAMEAALSICKKRPLLNSANGKLSSKQNMLPLAKKYNTDVVISVFTDKGIPSDVSARADSITDTVAYANELGIPNEDIWVDPVILPVSADQNQVLEALEFTGIIDQLLPEVKSVVGLSNVSNGTPANLRGILNRTYLIMLARKGLYSAIVDVLDEELMRINRGEMKDIAELIYKVMDGEIVPLAGLSKTQLDYVKTARVLRGDILYSHAWLEM